MFFALEVRANLSPEERDAIDKYKLGDSVLYEKNTVADPGSGLLGLASRVAFKAMNMSVSVKDLPTARSSNARISSRCSRSRIRSRKPERPSMPY